MILGNKTLTPRAVYVNGQYVAVPPMGVVDIDDTFKDDVLAAIRPLVDAGAFVVNSRPGTNDKPVEIEGPKPPMELEVEPENPRVTPPKPKKTGEKMKV